MEAEKVKRQGLRATQGTRWRRRALCRCGRQGSPWGSRIDDEAVRNTRDVDLIVRPPISPRSGPRWRPRASFTGRCWTWTCPDGPQGKPSGGVHLLFAGEKVRAADEYPCPELDESERAARSRSAAFRLGAHEAHVLAFQGPRPLARMIQVGLVDGPRPRVWRRRSPSVCRVCSITPTASRIGRERLSVGFGLRHHPSKGALRDGSSPLRRSGTEIALKLHCGKPQKRPILPRASPTLPVGVV